MPRRQLSPMLTLLAAANHQLEARWRRDLGVSAYEMLALTHLRSGPRTIGDLGKRLALTSGAMTGLVDRLVKANLLERVPDPADGRRVLLHLTPSAQTRLQHLQREFDARIDAIEGTLTTEEIARIAGVLDACVDIATELGSKSQ